MRFVWALVFLAWPVQAIADEFVIDHDRVVRVNGLMDGKLQTEADKLMKLADDDDPIYIVINSRGGYTNAGTTFIDTMERVKARGIKLICVVPTRAASMAFYVFSHCTERYALPGAGLMWHPVRTVVPAGQQLTAEELLTVAKEIMQMEMPWLIDLEKTMGMPHEAFLESWRAEREWRADRLSEAVPKFIKIIPDVAQEYIYREVPTKNTGIQR